MPLSRTLPQMPPAPAPTAALARIVGGKISPTRPPAIAPRLAHFLPLGSAVSWKDTLPSWPRTTTAASIRSIEPSRSMARKSFSASPACFSLSNAATKTSSGLSVMSSPPRRDARRRAAFRDHPVRMTAGLSRVESWQYVGSDPLEDGRLAGVHAVGSWPVHDDLVEPERLGPPEHVAQVLHGRQGERAGGVDAEHP